MCLIAKRELKSDQIFMFFKLNEIHVVDSPFNEDLKNIIFSKEALISGEGRPEILTPLQLRNQKARTIKLCTVIAYYITSITKQLKFLNAHCSIQFVAIVLLCA